VVIITGYGTAENEVRAKAAGVSDFMRKPLSPEMIEESAAHALLQPALTVVPTLQASPVDQSQVEVPQEKSNFRNIALFLAAPFIGLAYAVFLPLVGLAMLAWIGGKALLQTRAAKKAPAYLRNVALFAFAPFIGLAYAIMLPFVGTAMLVWVGAKALMETKQTA
jgi:CheY-like chemotaxis protein